MVFLVTLRKSLLAVSAFEIDQQKKRLLIFYQKFWFKNLLLLKAPQFQNLSHFLTLSLSCCAWQIMMENKPLIISSIDLVNIQKNQP